MLSPPPAHFWASPYYFSGPLSIYSDHVYLYMILCPIADPQYGAAFMAFSPMIWASILCLSHSKGFSSKLTIKLEPEDIFNRSENGQKIHEKRKAKIMET